MNGTWCFVSRNSSCLYRPKPRLSKFNQNKCYYSSIGAHIYIFFFNISNTNFTSCVVLRRLLCIVRGVVLCCAAFCASWAQLRCAAPPVVHCQESCVVLRRLLCIVKRVALCCAACCASSGELCCIAPPVHHQARASWTLEKMSALKVFSWANGRITAALGDSSKISPSGFITNAAGTRLLTADGGSRWD